MKSETGTVTVNTTEIKKIISNYYNRLGNQQELDRYLNKTEAQRQIKNLNRAITKTEPDSVPKTLPRKVKD